MFERYTEPARRTLFFARYEASQLGMPVIAPEHLLLGLVREGKGLTGKLLALSDLELPSLRDEIHARLTTGDPFATSVEIPFGAAAKRILQYAAEEADTLLHNYIGTEHLLLGILREETSAAAQILGGRGLDIRTVRHEAANQFTTLTRDRLQSVNLRTLLARTLHAHIHRLELAPDLDRILSVSSERREVDVFVLGVRRDAHLTATGRLGMRTPPLDVAPDTFGPMSFSGIPMPVLAGVLENVVGRPVIDETGLDKRYDVEVSGPHGSVEAFVAALEREAGLTLTRARREIDVVVVG